MKHLICTSLLLATSWLSPAAEAPVLKMDFTSASIPGDNTVGWNQPYTQHGIRLTPSSVSGNTHQMVFHGSNSSNWVGVRSIRPSSSSSATTTLKVEVPGRRFSMKSMRIHPSPGGPSATLSIYGNQGNGNLWNQLATTGTATSGTLITFGPDFANLQELFWNFEQGGGGVFNFHHISEITVALVPIFTLPAAFTVNEAAGSLSVPIGLTTPWTSNVSVNYFIGNGTASSTSDYGLPGGGASGSLTIPVGATSINLTIPITNDTTTESPETFQVVLSSPTHGFLLPGGGATYASTVTIASDDGIANFSGWMTAHGLTGNAALAEADPNQDGITNLESWLCRLNPASSNPAAWLDRRAAWAVTATNQPALRLTAPLPLPNDVRLIFEESTTLDTWTEQARRSGFGTGSLWSGPGASRVTESSTLSTRTITLPGSQTIPARSKAWFRLRYELFNAGGND